MNASTLLLPLMAIATSNSALVLAVECTTDDLTTISKLPDCSSVDVNNKDSLKAAPTQTSSSTGGVNIKASLQAADYYCGADATGSSDDRS
ncbi:hypothetical protein GN958_ATG10804 [Phytophthora infestans]|uniref:Uncharacterized protein n=1 Tax=Phytophthora infestans TaxID=4787 RepID=A0A8S9UM04_PHYIN|nr:hypothetical protein GN958_ATG10804 [Phytophthora infestans]